MPLESNLAEITELDSVPNLVARLMAIRERLFWLAACWANSLSPDIAYEADRYRALFRDLADELRKKDRDALEQITSGHENLLFAEPSPAKPSIPLMVQQLYELGSEVQSQHTQPPNPKPAGYVPDGLQRFV